MQDGFSVSVQSSDICNLDFSEMITNTKPE